MASLNPPLKHHNKHTFESTTLLLLRVPGFPGSHEGAAADSIPQLRKIPRKGMRSGGDATMKIWKCKAAALATHLAITRWIDSLLTRRIKSIRCISHIQCISPCPWSIMDSLLLSFFPLRTAGSFAIHCPAQINGTLIR